MIAPLTARGFEVIAPDLRGIGSSAIGPDGLHDLVASALDMAELLDQLALADIVVVAGDFGGAVAHDLAVRRPDLVDRLVLFNCPLPQLPELADFPPASPGALDYPDHIGPVALPDVGHFVQWEAPEELVAATAHFPVITARSTPSSITPSRPVVNYSSRLDATCRSTLCHGPGRLGV